MIAGLVTADREATICLSVLDLDGQEVAFTAVLDTGFTGWLTLPPDAVTSLGLPWRERGAAVLADGSKSLYDEYDATVVRDGRPMGIPVGEADSDPLVGMSLMYGYELIMPIIDGGVLRLTRI